MITRDELDNLLDDLLDAYGAAVLARKDSAESREAVEKAVNAREAIRKAVFGS